jgi:tetratricopeptide (TPR) repeat protein
MRQRARAVSPLIFAAAASMAVAIPAAAQSGRLNGVVKNTEAQLVKGATIVAVNDLAQPHSFTVTTDDRGRFTIVGLQNGLWQLWISAPGYVTQEQPVNIPVARGKPATEVTLTKTASGPPGALAGINARDLQTELQAASALLDGGQLDQAITAYLAILAKAPALTMVNLQIGNGYLAKKDYDRAVAAYQEALKTEPDSERVKVAIATALVEKGDLQGAEAALGSTASAATGRDTLYALGEIKLAARQPDEAAKWFTRAADADPAWTRPVLKLGLIAFEKGDRETALKYLEKVIAASPNSSDAMQAKTVVEQIKKQAPDHRVLHHG